jgi:hypothetical protein
MPFPFYPVGALVATLVLAVTLTAFATVLHAIDRAVSWAGQAAYSGLVSGFRGWSESREPTEPTESPRAGDRDEAISAVHVEPVRPRAGLLRR